MTAARGDSARTSGAGGRIGRRVVVSGRVQGVGFRFHTVDEAQRLGLVGWVRNCADGTVETEFEGPGDAVEQMVEWLRTGPPSAVVSGIEVSETAPRPDSETQAPSFSIR